MLIAEDSDEENWIIAANNNYDLHSVVAELVFKSKWKEVAESDCQYYIDKQKCKCKKHKSFRDKIKTVNYALCYGATKFKLSQTLNITPDEAQQLINEYFTAIPKMKLYLDKVATYGKHHKLIRTFKPFRRIRFFNNPDNLPEEERWKYLGEIERQSKNTRIQGSAADQVKLAVCYLREEINKNNYPVKLILQVHDQILTECKDGFVDTWKTIMPNLMEKAASINCHKVQIKADCTVSKIWCK
jgi:DNA polymerase-1